MIPVSYTHLDVYKRQGILRVEKNFVNVQLPEDLPEEKMDNRILKVCKGLAESCEEQVVLVTKDILLRIKAQIIGIRAEDYTTEQVVEYEGQYRGCLLYTSRCV